jgi:hypothetical protein
LLYPWGRARRQLVSERNVPRPLALILAAASPCIGMRPWKPTPAKTKLELREMLAQAVRNTQPQTETKPEPKPLPKAKKGRG